MEWRSVPGYEGIYEVSDTGLVRHSRATRVSPAGKLLSQSTKPQGYKAVALWKDNKMKLAYVHRLVAQAFIGEPNGLQVNHKDGNKTNNAVSNLEYVTRSQNAKHAFDTGLMVPASKLTAEKVRQMRAVHKTGLGYKRIADMFGVTKSTAQQAINGTSWRHVDMRD